ncbi:hypothetical protein PHIN8_20050 [Polynucleobacter sp. HIN8]|nr:hypothetical protein PHIN8_20050 [Polynucleobacter sp. HIN8]
MFNLVKTAILMAAITALFIVIGGILGGQEGVIMALLFALGMNFFSYWYSDQLVLRMTNAQEVDEHSAPQFYAMVQELAAQAQLPMPLRRAATRSMRQLLPRLASCVFCLTANYVALWPMSWHM